MAKKTFIFNKLVRDKIHQMLFDEGCTVNNRELVGQELLAALKNKLIEEAYEVMHSKSIEDLKEELADLQEVISSIMSFNDINPEEVDKIRLDKNHKRGSFSRGIYVSSIEIDEKNPMAKYYTARTSQYPEQENNEIWTQLQQLVNELEIVIDRPINSVHPKYPDFIYPVDYGFLKGSCASDGNEIDIWVGTSNEKVINGILCPVDPMKKDVETKIIYSCTNEEIAAIFSKMNVVLKAVYIPNKIC